MYKKKKILALIPARKGSKSIINKNLLKIKNQTLVEIAIKSAKNSKFLSNIIVTSDDVRIINLAKKNKIKTIKRKKKLSGDKTLMYNVVLDVVKKSFEQINAKQEHIDMMETKAKKAIDDFRATCA